MGMWQLESALCIQHGCPQAWVRLYFWPSDILFVKTELNIFTKIAKINGILSGYLMIYLRSISTILIILFTEKISFDTIYRI